MLYDIHLPELKTVKEEGDLGVYEIGPLYPGYGMTIGNSLRRVILSSLPGAAVTAVKIQGVSHEFSSIPNVKEDVIEIILNLKKLRVKLHSDEEFITLSASGKKKVTAKDIKVNQNVEIVNKDLHIATLDNSSAKLDMEIKVERGRGFVPVEKRKNENLGIGMIAIDALYAPIRRVHYSVEKTRVGQMTDLDKLIMTIETDGTISGSEAIKKASEILIDHFLVLTDKEKIERKEVVVEEEPEDNRSEEIYVEEINLSQRTANALLNNDIKTVKDILQLSLEELKNLKGFGAKAFEEVQEKIKELGFEMKDKGQKDA